MPKVTEELDADQFRAGDVWVSPRGTRYKVTRVTRRAAYLVNDETHRTVKRAYDDIGWRSSSGPWVRLFSGTEEKS